MTRYVIDRRFTSRVKRTPRVIELAEAFGLGLAEKEFVIYDNLAIDVSPGDVVYITGQSGSGKSLLLRDLIEKMRGRKLKVADLKDVWFDPEKPIIDQLGTSTTDAARLLSLAGISDAWIYIRRPAELSDGQRYRLALAKILESDADVWVADEFGAVLDRETAKCVAFNMQKVARMQGKTLMVATTHTDLKTELGPTLTIIKRFAKRIDVESDPSRAALVSDDLTRSQDESRAA